MKKILLGLLLLTACSKSKERIEFVETETAFYKTTYRGNVIVGQSITYKIGFRPLVKGENMIIKHSNY
jgi:uncharacterized lipoprotein YajG